MRWLLLGKTPPPLDGQAIVTHRLIELLKPEVDFIVVRSSPRGPGVRPANRFGLDRSIEVLRYLAEARRTIHYHRNAPILYANFSGTPLGHLRDVLTFLVAIPPERMVVVWPHNAIGRLLGNPIGRRSVRLLSRRTTHWVALNHYLIQELRDLPLRTEQLTIIPNPIEAALIPTEREISAKLADADPVRMLRLLFVGHLIAEKGFPTALLVLEHLSASGIPAQLTCVGTWPSEAEARRWAQWVRRRGLQDRVCFRGPVQDREQLRALYLEHHVLLFPTRYPWELQPLVVLEALAAACPVISTPRGGIPELILSGEHGALVDPENLPDLIRATEAYRDPDFWRAQARNARRYFETHFHPDQIRRRWLELLRGLVTFS